MSPTNVIRQYRDLQHLLRMLETKLILSEKDLQQRISQRDQPVRIQTINLHHVYLALGNLRFAEAVSSATYVTADGWPLVLYMRIAGIASAKRVTGSDMVRSIFTNPKTAVNVKRIGILGGTETTGAAVAKLALKTGREIVYRDHGSHEGWSANHIAAQVSELELDILLVAMTPPKSELIANSIHARMNSAVVLSVGGGLEMLAGSVRRAPEPLRIVGMEWMYRLIQEPKRLASRYLLCCLPLMVWPFVPVLVVRLCQQVTSRIHLLSPTRLSPKTAKSAQR